MILPMMQNNRWIAYMETLHLEKRIELREGKGLHNGLEGGRLMPMKNPAVP